MQSHLVQSYASTKTTKTTKIPNSSQVLNELGRSIGEALARVGAAGDGKAAADDEAVDACLNEIVRALLQVRGLFFEGESLHTKG